MTRPIFISTALTVTPQRLTLNNREYLVAPAVLVVAGVLNGGLLPETELRPEDWNAVPIVINHPLDNGEPISARTPDVLAQHGVGHLYRTRLGTARRRRQTVRSLQAELWIDTALVSALGGEALQAMQMIETQQPLEVSTAFFSDDESVRGVFEGAAYERIYHNIRPDHLALLPNMVGACNWADGCGAPRLNRQACACQIQETQTMEVAPFWQRFLSMLRLTPQASGELLLTVHQTDQDIRESLYGCLAREMGTDITPIFIDAIDVEAMSFTYRQGERLRRRRWMMEDGVLALSPDVEDVQRATTYTPVPVTQAQEEKSMSIAEVITRRVNALIANERTRWTEADRHMLEAQDEAFLIRLEQQPQAAPAVVARQPETMSEAIATLPQHLQEPLQAMADEYEQRKASAIKVLVTNAKNPFAEQELQAMTAQRLEQLVAMAGEEVPLRPGQQVVKEIRVQDYRGRGLPHMRPVPEDELPPEPPKTFALAVEKQRAMGKLAS
jgi:hypothetical protein